jgi:purine-binding chemotaxis protein CheW
VFRVCLFELAGEKFAIRLESISEIVAMAALSRPPSIPSVLDGFLNLGGAALPVLRTATLLGCPDEGPQLHTPLLVVREQARLVVLRVSRVLALASVESAVAPLDAANSFNGCIEGHLFFGGEPVPLLDVQKLLLEQEWKAVAEFQALGARRLGELEAAIS